MKIQKGRRWLVFAGPDYYAKGGALDFVGCYLSERRAMQAVAELPFQDPGTGPEWAQVVDTQTGEIVALRRDRRDGDAWLATDAR